MKIRMSVRDLIDGLSNVTRALAVRPVKPALECVLINAQEKCVTLTGTNGSLSIETTLTAMVSEEGRVVLPGRLLTELVRKLTGEEVDIVSNDNYGARISCAKVRATLAGINPDEFPEMNSVDNGQQLSIPQNMLREMITSTAFATAVDESKPVLTGCLLEVVEGEVRMVALDGYRLALQRRRIETAMEEGKSFKCIIPGKVMNELSKMLLEEETPCELIFDHNRMQATFANTKLSTVLLAGEYIDYRRILPVSFKTTVKAGKSDLQEAIDRASLMAREGKNNLIRMSFSRETLKVSSFAEMGAIDDEVEISLSGEPLDIAFNAKYISEVIRYVGDDELCMNMNSNVSPCVFVPAEGDSFLYLVLPVRVFQ